MKPDELEPFVGFHRFGSQHEYDHSHHRHTNQAKTNNLSLVPVWTIGINGRSVVHAETQLDASTS
jgi:hypothetical protein